MQPAPAGAASCVTAPTPSAPGEAWWSLGRGRDKIRVALLNGVAHPGQPLAAVVPLDATTPGRLRALIRLLRHLEGSSPPPDPITPQRRRRLKAMLRAIDGRDSGALHREIAQALYGVTRVTTEPWKSSPLRDTTMRLVRDGRSMVTGGYLGLLGVARAGSTGVAAGPSYEPQQSKGRRRRRGQR